MKRYILLLICNFICMGIYAQSFLTGRVISALDRLPIEGATIFAKDSKLSVSTDSEGEFLISLKHGKHALVVSMMGFVPQEIEAAVPHSEELIIVLHEEIAELDEVEVVSTGYYKIPRERSTGSFEYIGNELLNRSVSTDIISRLEGVSNSLAFDRRRGDGDESPLLRVRGLSTIRSDQSPLIVLDNFPYEGDISNINPNDVESVTLLKDASAASIWGARAGNGVIVIVTKTGKFGRPLMVSANSSVSIGQRPDLFFNRSFMSSSDFIAVERSLFEQGYYVSEENGLLQPPLSPVVELLIQHRDGNIDESELEDRIDGYKQNDIRQQAEALLYRKTVNQQHAVNFRGGSERIQYYASGGFDKNMSAIVGNGSTRVTLTSNTTLKLTDKLTAQLGFTYNHRLSDNNGLALSSVRFSGNKLVYPYAKLVDDLGRPVPIIRDYRVGYIEQSEEEGLLDWRYRPLEERDFNENSAKNTEMRINTGLSYEITSGLSADFKFQYQRIADANRQLNKPESYVVRGLVNRYTQDDGQRIFPEGGILNLQNNLFTSYSFRGQVNYAKRFGLKHDVSGLAGFETRIASTMDQGYGFYGYDDDILTYQTRIDYLTRFPVKPWGTAQIPTPSMTLAELEDRFVSYFSNLSYAYDNTYMVNASLRWDASNLFGVRTNQKGVPLWSAGVAWLISGMPSYELSGLSFLKLRATYGHNGNINKMVTAYPTAAYSTDRLTGLRQARIIGPGNADLRWEKVNIVNLGLDFGIENNRLRGSLEYFTKRSNDLIGEPPVVDPTMGYRSGLGTSYLVNYANLKSWGWDVMLNSINIDKGFSWKTDLLVSYVRNRVTRYAGGNEDLTGFASNFGARPQEGHSLDALFVLPWHGLDPVNGDPLVMLDGELSKEYTTYIRSINSRSDLVSAGLTFPPYFGSIRNTVEWKGFAVSANIIFKFGYVFRRNSIDYSRLFGSWEGHRDFGDRWKNPGDERHTAVPSMPRLPLVANRDQVYAVSEMLVESGDHIRLQDINVSYLLKGRQTSNLFQQIKLFIYAQPPGWIWRAAESSLDPDRPESTLRRQLNVSIGLNITL